MAHAPTSGGYWLKSTSSGAFFFDARFRFLCGRASSSPAPRRLFVLRFPLARFACSRKSSSESAEDSSAAGESLVRRGATTSVRVHA